jgi:hypothetical protein
MRIRNFLIFLFAAFSLLAFNNCGNSGFEGSVPKVAASSSAQTLPIIGNEANVTAITMSCGYINEPCVSVTICVPGTATCQTIPKILLDTGSYGLRLFSSKISITLPAIASGGGNLTECISYLDNTSQWGPVKTADVMIGQRKASSVPIHVIDATYGTAPGTCPGPENDPVAAGYNGILGVGLFTEDCGSGCATVTSNHHYYSCSGATCTETTVPIAQQVSNPVSFMTTDNNGVILQLPAVPSGGTTALSGWLVLGIGTQTNNIPVGVNTLFADGNGYIQTKFNGQTYTSSFLDSGSNGLFFPNGGLLTECSMSGGANGFYCPASLTSFSAVQAGTSGSPQVGVSFQVINAESALAISNQNTIFNNLGGKISGNFDWGIPFFFGRTVFNGIDGKTSSLGTGPYFAW